MKRTARPAIFILILVLVLALILAGCEAPAPRENPQGFRFTDALGQEISLSDPERVVALMGGLAETWLLAGGELVGVTEDALSERDLNLPREIGVVGQFNAPNFEAILSLEPDLVLLSSETPAHVDLLQGLTEAGITAAYFQVTHFDDYLDMLAICTDITGRRDLYEENGLAIKAAIDATVEQAPDSDAPVVLLLITHSGGAAVQNAQSMTGNMLREMGCVNLTDQVSSLLKEFSMEAIIAGDPDYIFVISMGNDDEAAERNLRESLEGNPAWKELTAVKEGQYHLLPKELFLYKPNARWAESYHMLWEVLYGAD